MITIQDKQFEIFISQKEIQDTVNELSIAINNSYSGKQVVIIGILDGAILFLSDLIRKLNFDVTIELIKLKSYVGTKSLGTISELIGITQQLEGKHVLIAEDIVDTGNTISHLLATLRDHHKVASVEIATLLLKEDVFGEKFAIKYVGKKIADKFVVGYGMDFNGQGRQLPDIYVAV